jgi:hypothetical protein
MMKEESGMPSLMEAREVENGSFELTTHLQEEEAEAREEQHHLLLSSSSSTNSNLNKKTIRAFSSRNDANGNYDDNDNASTVSSIASASVNNVSRITRSTTSTNVPAPTDDNSNSNGNDNSKGNDTRNGRIRRPDSNRTQQSELSSSTSVSSSVTTTTTASQGNSRKKLLGFIASDPANRSCSDCHCLLMDFTKMYCSFRDIHIIENDSSNQHMRANSNYPTNANANARAHECEINIHSTIEGEVSVALMNNGIETELTSDLIQGNFATFHNSQFKPAKPAPFSSTTSNGHARGSVHDNKHVSMTKMKYRQALQTIAHAVFLCKSCAEAHKKLPISITIVKSITLDSWTMEQVQLVVMSKTGGNSYAKEIFERYIQQGNCQELRPNAHSSNQTREIFARAKYQVLAFLLPHGPLVMNQRNSLSILLTPARKRAIANGSSSNGVLPDSTQQNNYVEEALPNRLVDYFCIVSSNGMIELPTSQRDGVPDLSTYRSPLELSFQTNVTECFPSKETHGNPKLFPEHLNTFVFPQGCKPTKRQTPTLFTFTLTNEMGTKMYGAALHLYDSHLDLDQIYSSIEESGYKGVLPPWLDHYPPLRSRTQSWKKERKKQKKSKATELSGNDSDMFFLPKSLVVLSHYPFFDIWRRFLLQIYHISIVSAPLPIERYIANFVCEVPVPPMGKVAVKVQLANEDVLSLSRPPINRLPLLNCSLRPLFACLSVSNVMVVVGCLLQETRVAICSRHLALLGPVCETLAALLFPFVYQGIYIPCLPDSLAIDFLEAPIPFLVGIHRTYLDQFPLDRRPLGVVFVDLDHDVVHLGFDEKDNTGSEGRLPTLLPEKDANKLKSQLEACAGVEFIAPGTNSKGRMTYGAGSVLPNEKRPTYCRAMYAEATISRSQCLAETDMAFLEYEHLMPIDFSAGTLTNTNDSKGSNEFRMKGVRKAKKMSTGTGTSVRHLLQQPKHLLDIDSNSDKFDGHEIRNVFLRFLVTLFVDYEKYVTESENSEEQFQKEKFIYSHGAEAKSFVSEVIESQMFQRFIEEKIFNSDSPSVQFFDDSIVAKKNRSKSTVGRRKETQFINDDSGIIVETFVPPDVSNAGISEMSFHYTKFPHSLDHSLVGSIRIPKILDGAEKQGKRRAKPVQKSIRIQQQVLADLLKPLSLSETEPETYVEKDTNWALHAIAFHDNAEGEDLDQTLPPMLISKAGSVITQTREKQVISVANLIVLQRFWISHRIFPKYQTDKQAGPRTIVTRDSWLRPGAVKTSWSKLKNGITVIQSKYRTFRIRQRYLCCLLLISKMQGLARGFLTRKQVQYAMMCRIVAYNKQIVALWDKSFVSLFYRSRFVLLNDYPIFLRHRMLENELLDLYRGLGISVLDVNDDEDCPIFVQSSIYATFLHVQSMFSSSEANEPLFSAELSTKSELAIRLLVASRRIELERVQIYEKLLLSPIRCEIYGMYNVALSSKKKKASIASMIWNNGSDAVSSTAMRILFPELIRSSNVTTVSPSRKAFARAGMGSTKAGIPPFIDRSKDLEYKSDNLIRTNLAIAAKGLLTISSQKNMANKLGDDLSTTLIATDKLRAFVGSTNIDEIL